MHFEVQWHPHLTYACIRPPPPERSSPKYDSKIAALVNISYPDPTLTHQLYDIDQLSSSLDYTF